MVQVLVVDIEVASVINLSEALGRVAAGLFMTEGELGSAHRAGGTPPSGGGVPPGRWVSVGSLPTATHRPGGTPPPGGGVHPARWAEPNCPRVSNLHSDH